MNTTPRPLQQTVDHMMRPGSDLAGKLELELIADLERRHPEVLAGERPAPGSIVAALTAFAAAEGQSDSSMDDEDEPEDPDPEVIDLADSLMKSFAKVFGRAQWTPALALAWNAELRRRGEDLLELITGSRDRE